MGFPFFNYPFGEAVVRMLLSILGAQDIKNLPGFEN